MRRRCSKIAFQRSKCATFCRIKTITPVGQKRRFLTGFPASTNIKLPAMTKTPGKTFAVLARYYPLDTFKPIWLNLNALDHLRIHAQPIFLQEFAQPVTVD